jgi:uncharacterized RDD family membrane protein YckC
MSDLVTGEAVVLELRLAKLASRALALAIDLVLQIGLLLVGTLVLAGLLGSVDDALSTALALVFYVAVVVGYPVAMETATRGRSLGKLAFGLRVVRDDGGPVRFRHALVRALLAVVEIWVTFGSIALIASLASSKGKRLGDYLAGTVVVRERVPVPAAPVAPMPPPLAAWAAGLDLSRVPDDLALAARQYLSRGPASWRPRSARRWATGWRVRWRRSPHRLRRREHRPGRSCPRCSPSGGAASWPASAPARNRATRRTRPPGRRQRPRTRSPRPAEAGLLA